MSPTSLRPDPHHATPVQSSRPYRLAARSLGNACRRSRSAIATQILQPHGKSSTRVRGIRRLIVYSTPRTFRETAITSSARRRVSAHRTFGVGVGAMSQSR